MEYDLVFEGGGAKGMVFVGAMQEFERRGHTYKRLLGTSAGAITAALLAAGYNAQEMLEALGEKNKEGKSVFSTFMAQPGPFEKAQVLKSATLTFLKDVNLPFLPDFIENRLEEAIVSWLATDPKLACPYSLMEFGGWYSADHFITWMKRRLDTGTFKGQPRNFSGMTLSQFHNVTGVDLSLVASDTTGGSMLVLNHRTAPDVPLVWAVRMSMSIPLLWQEVVWQPEWGTYRGKEKAGHAIVDGGILSNFPIELFVSQDVHVKNLMGVEAGKSVLGMLIDEDMPVPGTASKTMVPVEPEVGIGQAPLVRRLSALVNTTLSAHDKLVSESFEDMVVRLPARGYGTTEFEMSDERRGLLVQAGCDTLNGYFENLAARQQESGEVSFGIGEEAEPVVMPSATARRQAEKLAGRMLDE